MRNTLLRMSTVLLCAMAACAAVVPVVDFDLQKAAGKWYIVGTATNAEWFVNIKSQMNMSVCLLTPTDGGNLNITYSMLKSDGVNCSRITYHAVKAETPGHFTFHSEIWKNDNDFSIADIVYNEYAVIHTIKTKNGVVNTNNALYSRSPNVTEVMQQKFREFSEKTGIENDNIVILPSNGECPDES